MKILYIEKYAYNHDYIVARDGGDGHFYFWGAYDTEAECIEVVNQMPRAQYFLTSEVEK